MRLTKKRSLVLDTLNRSVLPMAARDIYRKRKRDMDLATVYRTLQMLEQADLIEGFTLCRKGSGGDRACGAPGGTVRYYFRRESPHRHFVFCEKCHRFTPFVDCRLASTQRTIERKYKYKINHHVLYFTGLCLGCQ